MSDGSDQPRLSEDGGAPEELRSLLREAKADGAPDAARARLTKMAAELGAAGAAATLGTAGVAKLVMIGVLVIGAGVGIAVWARQDAGAEVEPTHEGAPTTAPEVETPEVEEPVVAAPEIPAPEIAAPEIAAPEARSAEAPTAEAVEVPAARVSRPTTVEEGGDSIAAETRLLESARSALSANPGRALALTSEHARRFPQGEFAQEREVIAIDALVRVNRAPEADRRLEAFAERYPSSAHLRRLRGLVHGAPH